jgi:hypothetical protein
MGVRELPPFLHSVSAPRGARASPVPFRASYFTSGLHPPDATPQRLTAYWYRQWRFPLIPSPRFVAHAMKFMDGMGGNPHWFYQGASEPLGLSRAGRSVPVSSMPLKGTGEARAPRGAETEWRNGGNSRTPITHTE